MSEGQWRALIVDDEPAWQEILREIVQDDGLAVDLAADLGSAMEALAAVPHRLAIVDLALSPTDHLNRDGLQVLDAVRRQDPCCAAILLTGHATVELAVNALTEHGAVSCLRKEAFRRSDLRALMRRLPVAAPTGASRPGSRSLSEAQAARAPQDRAASAALLVEDDAGWRLILSELLGERGIRVEECVSYGQALGALRRSPYDLAVVDLSLASSTSPFSNRDGYQVLTRTHLAGIPSIVVSGRAAISDVERAFADHGVVAFFEKHSFDRLAFSAVVEGVMAGAASAESGGLGPDSLSTSHAGESPEASLVPTPSGGALPATITPRELEALQLLAQGCTNKDIAHAMAISTNTVKRFLKSIFGQLGVNTRAAAAARAVSAGMPARKP